MGLGQGDLLVHSFDLPHGVHIWSGTRYSLVFWFKDSLEAVEAGTQPWQEALVAQRHPDGLFGRVCAVNLMYSNAILAISHLETAAAAGHFLAHSNLGPAFLRLHAEGNADSLKRAIAWFRSAALTGFSLAQRNYALLMMTIKKDACNFQQDSANVFIWMRRAA